ncbi:MAG: protein-glutamate O-methyltransferase [Fibrobacteres bacterium]|nr:protein-glutamate O-methyltransferase [Fibrobacterota bacterium]
MDLLEVELTDSEFRNLSSLIHERCGINIQEHKKSLIKGRLAKRLKVLGLKKFKEYYEYILKPANSEELVQMIDAVSTNVTHFFREQAHFDFLRDYIIPDMIKRSKEGQAGKLRVWCAASSSGEEPYSLAMTFLEHFNGIQGEDFMILGSDISTRVLKAAQDGVYTEDKLGGVSKSQRLKYFENGSQGQSKVKDSVKKYLVFKRINLMDNEFPFRNPLDVIFCRNVMIYFDKSTQQTLVQKFHNHLKPGGYLFLGHSEGLTGVKHKFSYVQPSVYRKDAS